MRDEVDQGSELQHKVRLTKSNTLCLTIFAAIAIPMLMYIAHNTCHSVE